MPRFVAGNQAVFLSPRQDKAPSGIRVVQPSFMLHSPLFRSQATMPCIANVPIFSIQVWKDPNDDCMRRRHVLAAFCFLLSTCFGV